LFEVEARAVAALSGTPPVLGEAATKPVGLPWAQSRTLLLSHFGETFRYMCCPL
jgi:hypothetical protein